MMTDAQSESFENELKIDSKLLERFNKIKNNVSGLNIAENDIDFDERYFNTILPKVRARIDKKSLFITRPKFIYSAASIVAALILFLVLVPTRQEVDFSLNNYRYQLEDIINEDGGGDAVDDIFLYSYSYSLRENNFDRVSEELDMDLVNELTDDYNLNRDINILHYTEPYEYIEDFNDQEINTLLNEINKMKIL
jgi:hypothetical protein